MADQTHADETPFTRARDAVFPPTEKPAEKPKDADEKTPQEKAAETRAKNQRAEARAERQAQKQAEQAELPAKARTWSCPACGRGTTLPTADAPDGPMLCQGCGLTNENWLAPGFGHGEPELQV